MVNRRVKFLRGAAAVLLAAGVTTGVTAVGAGAQQDSVADEAVVELAPITFTDTQARRGEASYGSSCSRCHGADLRGVDGPPLVGEFFEERWADRSASEFLVRMTATMPADSPGSLSSRQYLALVAYIARENGAVASDTALSSDEQILASTGFIEATVEE